MFLERSSDVFENFFSSPSLSLFFHSAAAPSGPESPHCRGFRHTTPGKTPPDEWSARRRDLYLTTHNTDKRHIQTPASFEPAIRTSERLQTHALDSEATEPVLQSQQLTWSKKDILNPFLCVCMFCMHIILWRFQLIETREAVFVWRNTETRSRNRYCLGKAISITYLFWVRVFSRTYPACNTHTPYCVHIVICGLSASTIFFHIIWKMALLSGKKLLHMTCVFWFSLLLFSETFLILRIIKRGTIINVHRSSCKVSVILVIF